MINPKVASAINEQIKNELESAYLYYAMQAYFTSAGFDGMANWMSVQVKEELFHASKFYDYVLNRGGQIQLKPLAILKTTWESPLSAFKEALAHEEFITNRINFLMKTAIDENDFASKVLLDWYVNEQVEEESNVSKIIASLAQVKNSGEGLLVIDRELATRVFVMPTPRQGAQPA